MPPIYVHQLMPVPDALPDIAPIMGIVGLVLLACTVALLFGRQ